MLRSAQTSANPYIKKAVDELLREETHFDRSENRSAIRDHLVRAVTIALRESEETISAFSRNISATGIGLITSEPVTEKAIGTIAVERLHGADIAILSECRWCKPYGENWYFSGWQFINIKK